MKFGIYRLEFFLGEEAVADCEAQFQVPISVLSFYRAWNQCDIEDDRQWFDDVAASPREVLLTWEPWLIPPDPDHPEKQPDFSLQTILSGKYDNYIRSFARMLKEFPRRIYLRPMHEMNGFWYPWCGTVNGNRPEEFRFVWRHLRRLFAAEGAGNIAWVWSPYTTSHPPLEENAINRYFPGAKEIDVMALDGYNWGTSTQWGTWQDFGTLFTVSYKILSELSDKPIIIAETACAEQGGNKGEWIRDMLSSLPLNFPRIEAIVWFDIDKECDWRLASSSSSLRAFRQMAENLFGNAG